MGARKQNFDQNDSDYVSKRARNNEAVKRWRVVDAKHLTLMHIFDSWTSVYPTSYQQYDIAYAKLPNNNLSLYNDLIWGWT